MPTNRGGAPSGGTTGQVLTKNSNTSYDYGWAAGGGGATPTPSATATPTPTVPPNQFYGTDGVGTLGFGGITVTSTSGIYVPPLLGIGSGITIGKLTDNLTVATIKSGSLVNNPSNTSPIAISGRQASNGKATLLLQRNTDTSPAGDFISAYDIAATPNKLFNVDINGVITVGSYTASVIDGVYIGHSVTLVVDGGGIVLGTGTKNPVKIPYGGTLQGWTAVCSPASCSLTIDLLRAADGAGLPSVSMVGGGTQPAITNTENSATTFPSWTSTTLTAKDNLAISLSGITGATYCEITFYYK